MNNKRRYFKYLAVFVVLFSVASSLVFSKSRKPNEVKKTKQEAQDEIFKKAEGEIYGMNDSMEVDNFDEEAFSESRRAETKALVDDAAKYLSENSFGKAMHEFAFGKKFKRGELYPFVYDLDGVCFSHGQDKDFLWQNKMGYMDNLGFPAVKMLIERAISAGSEGGWLNFVHRNAIKIAFVKSVEKDGKKLVIGSGYYPLAKKDLVVSLVRSAVETFKNAMKTGISSIEGQQSQAGALAKAAFSEFSYPLGRFILGDLYLFALDFDGNIVAQGDFQDLIGTNARDYKDEAGKYINRDIIQMLKDKDSGVWVEYMSKGARKLTYAEKVTDRDGKSYFIACGYYPDSTRRTAVNLVKRGVADLAKNGIQIAADAISSRESKEYRDGDLFLAVYNYKGYCIAHGLNPAIRKTNKYDMMDENGKYPVRMIIEKSKAGGGWINYKARNAYLFTYVEEVEVGGNKYAVACGIFPTSKVDITQLMVKDAAGSIRDIGLEKSLEEFVRKEGKFVKGDIEIFLFDFSGLCYAYGTDHDSIWKEMMDAKDQDGRPFVRLIINTAKDDGSGVVVYKENGKTKAAYVMRITKDGKDYAVGSGFYIK